MGYHINKIEKGVLGSISKIKEEFEELLDAHSQGSTIMELVELSDLYGAIKIYLEVNYPGISMKDLELFSIITERAFKSGDRQ
jgi:hypothetical protein